MTISISAVSSKLAYVIIILSLIIISVLYLLTSEVSKLSSLLHKDCPLPAGLCIFERSLPIESAVGFFAALALLLLGFNIEYHARRAINSGIKQNEKLKKAAAGLAGDKKLVFEAIAAEDGFAFQNELAAKLGMSKVRITRALDRLEGKGLIERKRRGITNAVILKHG